MTSSDLLPGFLENTVSSIFIGVRLLFLKATSRDVIATTLHHEFDS
jgi:hypothetical protein